MNYLQVRILYFSVLIQIVKYSKVRVGRFFNQLYFNIIYIMCTKYYYKTERIQKYINYY